MGNLCKSLLKVEGQPGNKVPTRAAEKLIQTIQATTSYIQQTTMNIHFFCCCKLASKSYSGLTNSTISKCLIIQIIYILTLLGWHSRLEYYGNTAIMTVPISSQARLPSFLAFQKLTSVFPSDIRFSIFFANSTPQTFTLEAEKERLLQKPRHFKRCALNRTNMPGCRGLSAGAKLIAANISSGQK